MAIQSDYPRPINVNGYVCRNCEDVSKAKKFIDPAAPKGSEFDTTANNGAVVFGGSLADRRITAAPDTRAILPGLDRYA